MKSRTRRSTAIRLATTLSCVALTLASASVQAQGAAPDIERLQAEFKAPPAAARPWTWFHVMSGNMSREGLTKDLESLADAGVGGIVLFHVTQGIPHGTVRFNSPEHLDLITHAAAECERLGLAFNFHNADGWSSTGGPWITPEQGMKRVVWSEQVLDGGTITAQLAQPSVSEGFYRDISVLAYPALAADISDAQNTPVFASSDPELDLAALSDGDLDKPVQFTIRRGQTGWISASYEKPVSIRSLTLHNSPTRGMAATLEISDDGENWRMVQELNVSRPGKYEWMVDAVFDPIEARHFRISSENTFSLAEFELSARARIPDHFGHSGAGRAEGRRLPQNLDMAASSLVDPAQIIDLTGSMDGNGTLTAQLPEGQWTVVRFGYTSTRAINVNGSPEGTGLEVDKFSAAAFQTHYDAFIGPVIERARAAAPNALSGVMIDSYEVGGQNWTEGYDTLFEERFGEPITPWLLTFTGRLVDSPEKTRVMLANVRRLNADLIAEEYYGKFADLMAADGVESIIQPYGIGPQDDLQIGGRTTVPAGEFWVGREVINVAESVSTGRMYDKPVIFAEAFTSEPQVNWNFSPKFGKKWGDRAWTGGINQFMFHRFAHQANTHVMPGMTMHWWGSHFDRTQPWWDKGALPWFTYMARGHHMLQQGVAVSDIAMFTGEDSPVGCPEKASFENERPAGTEFDCLDAETLLSRAQFADGKMVLPSGMTYPVIWWREEFAPSDAAKARLYEARAAGVTVAMRSEGDSLRDVYEKAGLSPRLSSTGDMPMFTQRRVGDTDIFFLLNFDEEAKDYALSFDVGGKAPQVWNPETGVISAHPASITADGRTQLGLKMEPGHATFLVFDPSTPLQAHETPESRVQAIVPLDSDWSLTLDPAYSPLGTVQLPQLIDLSTSDEPELRYFSGKATYRKTFNWGAADAGSRVMLDLGAVESIATVRVNGQEVRTLWMPPFTLDISDALTDGENVLEIEVANLWINRLIGDAALEDTSGFVPAEIRPKNDMVAWYSANEPMPEGPRRTFTTRAFVNADSDLVPSGLMGPVQLRVESE